MSSNQYPFSQQEFDSIFSKVPRLTVEIIIKNSTGAIYLAKRAIVPCVGQWHLPGGTVQFGEPMIDTVSRVAKKELGISVQEARNVGYIEYPSHYKNGLDSPVGIVFEVSDYSGEIATNEESQDSGWFSDMPLPMHADQDEFLLINGYLRQTAGAQKAI